MYQDWGQAILSRPISLGYSKWAVGWGGTIAALNVASSGGGTLMALSDGELVCGSYILVFGTGISCAKGLVYGVSWPISLPLTVYSIYDAPWHDVRHPNATWSARQNQILRHAVPMGGSLKLFHY